MDRTINCALMVYIATAVSLQSSAALAGTSTTTFSSQAAVLINDSATPPTKASPYPSTIFVGGLGGHVVGNVNVVLSSLTHDVPDNIDILLVGPGGKNLVLMSDAGGTINAANVTLTFSDSAPTAVPDNGPLATGTYRPANYVGTGTDSFPSPAPSPSSATTLATFNGINPNGNWSLYVVDDNSKASGLLATGWSLVITAVTNDDCANAFSISNGNLAFTTVGATTDGPPLPPGCDQGSGLGFGSDIWYRYIPTCDGTLTVSTCNQASFDTRLAAYSGSCSNLTLLGCNDDGLDCNSFTSLMNLQVFSNQPILLRVGGYANNQTPAGAQGTGTLSLTFVPQSAPFNGWALEYNGTSDFVSVANNAGLDLIDAFTIEAWVRPDSISGDRIIVSKRSADNHGYALRLSNGKVGFTVAGVADFLTANAVVSPNVWTHIAVVYDAGHILTFFVNGQALQAFMGNAAASVSSAAFTIGKSAFARTTYFDGAIDELRVWTVVRTPLQIQTNMRSLLTGGEPGLTGYWRFDEGQGMLAADLTGGNNNPGVLNGPVWIATTICPPSCPADIAPSPTGNGSVNVDDLLTVINGWGVCQTSPCPGDISPPGAGNGIVNVDDLLLVINSWGGCP